MNEVTRTLKLHRPITAHGKTGAETLHELTLREPSGKLLLLNGLPFSTIMERGAGDVVRLEVRMIPAIALIYLAQMTGLDALVLETLSALDLRAAFSEMVAMLNPTEA